MRRPHRDVLAAFCIMLAVTLVAGFSPEEKVTIMGTVNEHYQILSDDDGVYTLGNGEQDEALAGAVGKRVVVIGSVSEHAGLKTISVASYQLLE